MQNKIKNLLLDSFPNLVIRDGKPISDILIKPAAAINEAFETEKANTLIKSFLGNYSIMSFEEMDMSVSNYLNTNRKIGRFSTGTVRIYLSQRTDIVFDKIRGSFSDVRGRRFIPRFDFAVGVENLNFDDVVGKYFIDIPVISEEPFGEEYLIGIGEINAYLGNNPFVEKVVNINQFVLVDLQESNTELYNRITQNGILLNSSRNNYFSNLILQTFPDIKKFLAVGAGNNLMKRDLTFNSVDAELAIREYNYYKKKTGSTIDNQNILYKGLLDNIELSKLNSPDFLLSLSNFSEVEQDIYDALSFKDKNAASVSSLLIDDLFYLFNGFSDLNNNNWIVTQNGESWNKGSSAIEFTNSFQNGIKIKGDFVTEPLLANNDKGLILYKKIEDVRNTEFLLNFVIDDLDISVIEQTATNTSKTVKKTISNNNPLYFTILKNGIDDKPLSFKGSTYDGYGVVIQKSDTNGKPNVFIIDGSSGTGKVAFEQEILQLGSERILAAAYIPLSAGIEYTCLMQVNEAYGLKVYIKGENNNELGSLIVGSGPVNADFTSTYSTQESFEEKEKSDTATPTIVPRIFKFKNTTNEDLFASSFLDLSYTIAKSTSLYLANRDSDRIISIPNTAPAFRNFSNVEIGDTLEIKGLKYLITNIYSSYMLEVNKDLPSFSASEAWTIWRPLVFNLDYSIPNKPFYNNLIVLTKGIEKINTQTSTNKNLTKLKFLYIDKLGNQTEIVLDWTDANATNMIAYEAQSDPAPAELKNAIIFDKAISNTLYYNTASNTNSYQAVYLTQNGYNKITSDYIRLRTTSKTYLKKKSEFEQGYYLPVPDSVTDVNYFTYINSIKLKSSGYVYTPNLHYKTFNKYITDILINPTYFNLFSGDVEIDAEVLGHDSLQHISDIGSSKGNNKVYITTGAISTKDYYSIIINNERFFIKNITLVSTNTPFSDKKVEITVDRNIGIISNIAIQLRKKTTATIDTSLLRYGYRYDMENTDNTVWTDALTIQTGSRKLIKGEDFDTDRTSKIDYYFINSAILDISGFDSTEYLSFIFDYKELIEERKGDGLSNFKPLSTGSYLGIGFKSINNGAWRIINVRSRKLLERYSNFISSFYVGEKPITNEDRLFIDLNAYSVNINTTTTPLNGSVVLIYNVELGEWEELYENSTSTGEESSVYLQYYDGEDKDERPFDFGYWDGSNFITVNPEFYPSSYVDKSGNMYLLFSSRGKNEKDFTGNILFGEAKLYLDYINIKWQRKTGIHLGNKLDLWVATGDTIKTTTSVITLNNTTKKIILGDSIIKPLVRVNYLRAENSDIDLNFELLNADSTLRFSGQEDLELISANTLSPGNYIINYDYLPNLNSKQEFINNLNHHVDVLIRNFVPVFVKLNIGYYGNIDVTSVKNQIYNNIRFSNILDVDYIRAIIESEGSILTTNVNNTSFATLEEFDLVTSPIKKEINSYYTLRPEKYFDIKLTDINLVKLK